MGTYPNGVDYDVFVAKWAMLPAATTGAEVVANLGTITALTVSGPAVDVRVSSVIGYLVLQQALNGIKTFASSPPQGAPTAAVNAASDFVTMLSTEQLTTIRMSDPTTNTAITELLAGLVAAGLLTTVQQSALLAMSETAVPWFSAAAPTGGGLTSAPNVHDLIVAGVITQDFAIAQGIY